MILVYHNITLKYNNENEVDIFHFFAQMLTVWLSKKQVVNLKNYADEKQQIVITFDDGYKGIKNFALPILKLFNFPCEIFIVEDFLNNNNCLSRTELGKIVNNNTHLQYHSKSHKNLCDIENEAELNDEIVCPDSLKELDKDGFEYFAYPYWKYNDKAYNIVKKFYRGARSGNGHGDCGKFAMNSIKVLNKINLGEIINE